MGRFGAIAIGLALAASCALAVGGAAAAPLTPAPQVRAAHAALTEVGAPYRWNGTSPETGFDASGLVVWAYAQAGVRGLPHASPALWTAGRRISRAALRPGDLVFFADASHVGIFIGHGRFVHATHTGAPVAVDRLAAYAGVYTGAVRIVRSR
ncbi:MAG TPA: C40 family peptidase [Gaiellales bacterium]